MRRLILAGACALGMFVVSAHAQDGADAVVQGWKSLTLPPPPVLKPATVEGARTAVLVIDMYAFNCTAAERPSCVRSVPHIAKLLADARAHHAQVIYCYDLRDPPSLEAATTAPPGIARQAGDVLLHGEGADKFDGTDLGKTLQAKGVQNVIVVGQTAQSAVLYTAGAAALRNFNVILPIDGVSARNPFEEFYAAWHLQNGTAPISKHVTLTGTDRIAIR